MAETRRKFDRDFKEGAVRLVADNDELNVVFRPREAGLIFSAERVWIALLAGGQPRGLRVRMRLRRSGA
jgi:hypothetical protein